MVERLMVGTVDIRCQMDQGLALIHDNVFGRLSRLQYLIDMPLY